MKENIYGFVAPNIDETHYKFGDAKLGALALKPDGDWSNSLPLFEAQNIGYETYSCVAFGTTNQIETLHKFLFQEEPNYSERFLADIVPIDPPGTDPQLVYEAIRKSGLIPQTELTLPATYADYITPRPVSENYLADGAKWLTQYEFGHDWVLTGGESQTDRINKLKAGLQFSPLGISVSAWFNDGTGHYIDRGFTNNHWVMCYKIDDKGIYVYDSYEEDHKILSLTHNIFYAKRITLAKKNSVAEQFSIIEKILNAVKQILTLDFLLPVFQKKVIDTPEEVVMPVVLAPKPDYITPFCKAIQKQEGWYIGSRSYRNNNPGNLKYAGQNGAVGEDKDGFAIFPDFATGFISLKYMVRNACTGKSKIYFPSDTILQFFEKFAPISDKNDPAHYAAVVANACGLSAGTLLKNLV